MTDFEWKLVTERVAALWGRSPKWAHAAHLIEDVHWLDYHVALSVVDDLVAAGSVHAPSPAEIIKRTRERQPPDVEPVDSCRHDYGPNPYGFLVSPDDSTIADVWCRVCGYSWQTPIASLVTASER